MKSNPALWWVPVFWSFFIKEALGNQKGNHRKVQSACQTEACINRATYLLYLMDQTVNPCEDFYKFACGNFMRKVEIPENKDSAQIIHWMSEYTESQLVSLLLAAPQPDEFQAHSTAKTVYKLCMDEAAMDRRGVNPLLEKLEAAGGWPVLGNWRGDNWNILDTEITLRELGFEGNSLFDLKTQVNQFSEFPAKIQLDEPNFVRGLQTGEGSAEVQNHYEYMVSVAELLGADRQTAEEQMAEVLGFQMQFTKFAGKFKYSYSIYNLSTLAEEADWLDWCRLLNSTVGKSVLILNDEDVMISKLEFIKELGGFLKNYSDELIANHMLWGAVEQMADKLTSAMRALKPDDKPRWQQCLDFISPRLSIALSSLFVKTFNNSKEDLEKMTEKLRQEFLRIVIDVEWLDDQTRLRVEEKLVRMGKEIAYSQELLDKTTVDMYYKNLAINKEHFFEAVLDIEKWSSDMKNSLLQNKKGFDWKTRSEMTLETNAFNYFSKNFIGISAGIIQNPFYDPDVPAYANYGALGVIIGHEMVHGFDNQGVFHDAEGNYESVWSVKSLKLFDKKKQCIIDQYSNFTDFQTNLPIEGRNTQGENIADNSGFKIAYHAYKRLVGNQVEPSLPGLQHFTNDQLFMISFAAPFCSKMTEEEFRRTIHYDSHSPGQFRILGVAMNSPEFTSAFHCKEGDPMNPSNKCVVW